MEENKKNPSETTKLERGYLKYGNAKYNILKHLRDGNLLTSREAFIKMGTTCLNTIVSESCKKFELEIPRKWIEVETRYGNKTKVKQYKTSKEDNEILDYLLEEEPNGL